MAPPKDGTAGFDLGIINPDSAGKKIPMTPQGSIPKMTDRKKMTIAGPAAEPSASIYGGDYFGPLKSTDPAANPLIIESPTGSRTSNVFGWAKSGIKKALGMSDTPPPPTIPATIATSTPPVPASSNMSAVDHLGRPMPVGTTLSLSAKTTRKQQAGQLKTTGPGGMPGTTAADQPLTGSDSIQTPGYSVAGEPNLSQLSTDQFSSISPTGAAGYNPAAGGGVAIAGDKAVFLRGRTAAEQAQFDADQARQQPGSLTAALSQTEQPQMTMVGSSTSEPRLVAPGEASFSPDVNKMSLGDIINLNRSEKAAARNSTIANTNSEIADRANKTALQAAELPSKIEANKANSRHLNVTSEIAGLKAPAEIKSIEEGTKHMTALTVSENTLRNLRAQKAISEINYSNGMLKNANARLGLLNAQFKLHTDAQKKTKDLPDYGLITKIALAQVKAYQDLEALGMLTPEQKFEFKRQQDVLIKVQQWATKPATYHGTPSIAAGEEA